MRSTQLRRNRPPLYSGSENPSGRHTGPRVDSDEAEWSLKEGKLLNLYEKRVGVRPHRALGALSSMLYSELASRAGGKRRTGLARVDPLLSVGRSNTSQGSSTGEGAGVEEGPVGAGG